MRIIKTIPAMRACIEHYKKQNKTIGFVPTMGALHDGHLSLIQKSKKASDVTAVSIFVNPTQFGPNEDFSSYPRPQKKDIFLAKKEKVDIIFHPSKKALYPNRYLTYINVHKLDAHLCGAKRPGHFQGVATIVGKLLNIVTPDYIFLGQKDIQQYKIIRQMIRDLNLPTKTCMCSTLREKDGVALSSRNQYLTPRQRNEAPVIFASLSQAKKVIRGGTTDSHIVLRSIRAMITKNSSGHIDYVECVDGETLQPIKKISKGSIIAVAVYFGKARLIDNIII